MRASDVADLAALSDTQRRAVLETATQATLDHHPTSSEGNALVDAVAAAVLGREAQRKRRTAAAAEAFSRCVAAWLADLLIPPSRGPFGALIYRSLRSNSFTGTPTPYKQAMAALDGMAELGLLERMGGFRPPGDIDFGAGVRASSTPARAARFRATPALVALAAQHGVHLGHARRHFARPKPPAHYRVLTLKGGSWWIEGRKVKGHTMEVPKTSEARALAERVMRLNAFLDGVRIEGGHHERFFRQFDQGDLPGFAWNKGGRLYSEGAGTYQQLKREDRAGITVNGEPTTEIDVKASYLTLLHGLAGRPFEPEGDPYEFERVPRAVVKAWATAAISKGKPLRSWPARTVAEYADKTGEDLRRHRPKAVEAELAMRFRVLWELETLGITWADLMFAESEAIMMTMERLAGSGVPSLPVYDSLIVPSSTVATAAKALKVSYQEVAGVTPMVDIGDRGLPPPPCPLETAQPTEGDPRGN